MYFPASRLCLNLVNHYPYSESECLRRSSGVSHPLRAVPALQTIMAAGRARQYPHRGLERSQARPSGTEPSETHRDTGSEVF